MTELPDWDEMTDVRYEEHLAQPELERAFVAILTRRHPDRDWRVSPPPQDDPLLDRQPPAA